MARLQYFLMRFILAFSNVTKHQVSKQKLHTVYAYNIQWVIR